MQKFRNRKGFTLIELMIVVVIIGILAALAIPRFSAVSRNSKQAEAESILKQVHTLQEAHFEKWNTYATALPADPAAAPSAANLTGWSDPGAKYFTVAMPAAAAASYCAQANLTAEGTNAGVKIMSVRVANKNAAVPAATDGKPQEAPC
ncbi:MAG: prepilin-type N-terminal cleavage/methylation domain-containing protein [Gemmatimonadetes bacterium]|nr:prepilin-type N-terminal cleavage/methylation domain-containing protein [Gemmatimonadota bacterium]MBA4159233.1 prepilin-type N-terminal cleavage/methylation domain-containing protein [Gemmatimonadota bacterium]